MRGTATRAPYSPWDSLPGCVSPLRSGMVFMVGIERERHGNLGTAGPRMRFQASAGANPLDISAPARLIPGPRLIFMRHVNTSS